MRAWLVIAVALGCQIAAGPGTASAGESPAELDHEAIASHAEALLAIPARAPGHPGSALAAALIEKRLADLGLTPLKVRHTVSAALDRGTSLAIDGVDIPVLPHLPNGAATAGTGGETISGRIVWLGDGELARFTGKDLDGAIAAFDANARDGWRYAAQLGARAAIFNRGGERSGFDLFFQSHIVSIEFPRFLADVDQSHDGQQAVLTSTVAWQPVDAWSVIALIPGTARKGQAVVLTTGYESPMDLPSESPGATEAWNAATLMELAARLVAEPPKRDVLLVFAGAGYEYHKGLRHLLGALTSERDAEGVFAPAGQLPRVRAALAAERWRCRRVLAALMVARMWPRGLLAASPTTLPWIQTLAQDSAALPVPAGMGKADNEAFLSRKLLDDLVAQAAADLTDAAFIPLSDARERRSRLKARLQKKDVAESDRERMTAEFEAVVAELPALEAHYERYRDIGPRLEFNKALTVAEDASVPSLLPAIIATLVRHTAVIDRRSADVDSLAVARGALGSSLAIHLIGLRLSDGSDRFSCLTGGGWVSWSSELNWLSNGLMKLADDVNLSRRGQAPLRFDRMPYDMPSDFKAYFPAGDRGVEVAVAACYPLTAAALVTTNDLCEKVGTPLDTAAAFRRPDFLRQTVGLHHYIREYIDSDIINDRRPKGLNTASPTIEVQIRTIGGKTGRRAFRWPMVALGTFTETHWCDAFGKAQALFVPEGVPNTPPWLVSVYGFAADGRIDHVIATKGQMGGAKVEIGINGKVDDVLALCFPCVQSRLFDVIDPRLIRALPNISVLNATRDSTPNHLHVEIGTDGAVAIFTGRRERLRVTGAEGAGINQMVITGELSTDDSTRTGLAAGDLATLTAMSAAADMAALNDKRVTLLRENGISSDSLVTLHSQAERHLEAARDAYKARDYRAALGQSQSSWALAGKVYPALLTMANDVVYGLVVMLLFAIPFALICERLFLAGNTIIKRVAGFTGFFIAIFLFFFFFHPAFDLATTPMVIFLAFVIIIMSVWVSSIVYKRFEHEMEQVRNARLGIHKADVSRLGTVFATVALGISNMRRRPMRTFLTGMTVVLMTFILLTFASFTSNVGSQRLALDARPQFDGIMLRRHGWTHLSPEIVDRVDAAWGDRFDLHPLRWLDPNAFVPKYPLSGPKGSTAIGGVTGVGDSDPTGLTRALYRGPIAEGTPTGFGGERDWLFLPPDVVERLGWTAGGEGRFWGKDIKVGLIDTKAMSAMTHLSGEALTPLAPEAMDDQRKRQIQEMAEQAAKGTLTTAESTSYTHLSPNNVGVVHVSMIERLGTGLVALTLTPKATAANEKRVDIDAVAADMAQQMALTIRVASRGEGYLLTAIGTMDVAGLGAVLVPLILGGLIIFSTMLNSVAERGKEIFIFSSLGLAPVHVAALFLVEASIYAILGGLGGYMVAQLIASALGVTAQLGWTAQPDLNYSSFTAVTTILLVMITVLLSALYPALIASRAANPGTSDFRVPQPDGDKMAIAFPFTVARRDIRGLLAYLVAYFDAHTEASTGCFTAADASMISEGERHAVTSKTWLAPFDLGISQRLVMSAVPTDVKAIYAVQLDLELLSGQRRAWRRANFAFLSDLRQQFLVWRTLSPEAMDKYRAAGGDPEAKARLATSTSMLKKEVAELGVVQ